MNIWMRLGWGALLLLGAVLALMAVFVSAFAGGEGSPAGRQIGIAFITIPVVYLLCLIASVALSILKKHRPALAVAAFPLLYALMVFGFSSLL